MDSGTKRIKNATAHEGHACAFLYKGVLREKGKVTWECDHYHRNRDNDSYAFVRYGDTEGMSALTCARRELIALSGGAK